MKTDADLTNRVGGPLIWGASPVLRGLRAIRILRPLTVVPQQREVGAAFLQAIFTRVAELIDTGKIKCTANEAMSPLNVANIIKAHTLIESGTSIGKLTIKR